jgi:hypothetical protein
MGEGVRTRILSIDIGVMNMGIVEVEKRGNSRPILLSGRKVDITDNGGCNGKHCELGHTGAMTDWVDHLLLYDVALQVASVAADIVLIERQPPLGFRDCEQLLFRAFRKNARLVSPRSVHAHFNMGSLCYEDRKAVSCHITNCRFGGDLAWDAIVASAGRVHDVADAALMALWLLERDNGLVARHRRPVSATERAQFARMDMYACKRKRKY